MPPAVWIGHSNGGDISVFFAREYPDEVKKVVTLDNLRVPFMTDGKFKILSFRSKDNVFKADPGVVPDEEVCEKAGITVVDTGAQHNDMSDRGPAALKEKIQGLLTKFLDDDSKLAPVSGKPQILDKPLTLKPAQQSMLSNPDNLSSYTPSVN
jgi:pimeloyl-ACP methyl ester carboxylesterase